MNLVYNTFYRKFGIRFSSQLITPLMNDIKFLDFPLESIYHFVSEDGLLDGPASDDFLFRNDRRPIPVETVGFLSEISGNPRHSGGNVNGLIQNYYHTHYRMRKVREIKTFLRDKQTVIVINYAMLSKLYHYPQNVFSNYNKWRNLFSTVIDKMADLSEETNRQQFMLLGAPRVIPSVTQLNNANVNFNTTNMRAFKDSNSLILLELWKWFSEKREDSLFSRIPRNKIHLINFIYQESGKWCLLNLGVLNSFYKEPKSKDGDEVEIPKERDYVIRSKQKIDGMQLRKRILRLMISIMEERTLTAKLDNLKDESEEAVSDENVTVIDGTENENAEIRQSGEDTDDFDENDEVDVSVTDSHPEFTYSEPFKEQLVDNANLDIIDHDIVSDMTDEEFDKHIKNEDTLLDEELSQLEVIAAKTDSIGEHPDYNLDALVNAKEELNVTNGVTTLCDSLVEEGLLSPLEYKKFIRLSNSYKTIKSIDGITTLDEFMVIPKEKLEIKSTEKLADSNTVVDKTMLHSSLTIFDKRYIKEVLHKDYANTVMSVQKAGIAVTGYKVETVNDILGGYESHTLKINPVVGAPSTIRFKLPIVSEDGSYTTNGVKYRLRKQRGDLPIRKTARNKVALTSYYGKIFIISGKKVSSDYGNWLSNQFELKALDEDDSHISGVVYGNCFDPNLDAPKAYTAISSKIRSCLVNGFELCFDHQYILTNYPEEIINSFASKGEVVIGRKPIGEVYLTINRAGMVFDNDLGQHTKTEIGSLEKFLNISTQDAPVEYATASVFGKDIPVGIILALELGFENLLNLLRVVPRRVPVGQRPNITADEYALYFNDEILVFSRQNKLASMILSGFDEYHRTLKQFSVYSFDKRGVYVNLLEANGIGVRFIREIDLMNKMFVDPITRDILIEMKKPITYHGLLFTACQMLLTENHPNELDPSQMRIKGYERFSGAIYNELVQAMRVHNGSLGKANKQVVLNPYAIWKRISEDPAKIQATELNPIASLKEEEAVTYGGVGGRSSLSMTKHTRSYHRNDMGTISEATTDNGDVGINIYTSADPNFTSLRGMSKGFDIKNPNYTSLLSTSALSAPGSDSDDQKRVNFVSIQQQHAIACDGYHQAIVRTGYETVIPQRTIDLFAVTAKQPGTVRQITKTGIIVDYADGTTGGYAIGRAFGNAQGLTVAHEIITPLKENDKFEEGQPIVYNTGFFEPDFFNPKQIVWKNSINAKTVLWESTQTHEDSSAISSELAGKLTTKVTKVKTIVVNFDQAINDLVNIGDEVTADTVLCIIEDSITANSDLFNAQSRQTLRAISAQAPKAHVKGVVESIRVYYNGEKADMSETLREIANQADKKLKQQALSVNKEYYSGKVDGGFRIDNNGLALDQIAICIYITSNVGAGIGDKGVFANQLKTCFGEKMEKDLLTESGEKIDAIFGYRSIEARIVTSPITLGTTASLLKVLGRKAVSLYRTGKE